MLPDIYLPIAETTASIPLIILIGFIAGVFSGLLGIGGGFISTPLLIYCGVPHAVAVATSAHQIVGASFAGLLARARAGKYEIKLGLFLAVFSICGSLLGFYLLSMFSGAGVIDFCISVIYMVVMGVVGMTLFIRALHEFKRKENEEGIAPDGGPSVNAKASQHGFLSLYVASSGLHVNMILLAAFGCLVGLLSTLMGIGGGFIVMPFLMYFCKMDRGCASGTSLIQIVVASIFIVFVHAIYTHSIDVVLGTLLIIGAVLGVQIGSLLSKKITRGYIVSFIFATVMLLVSSNFAVSVFVKPGELYEVRA